MVPKRALLTLSIAILAVTAHVCHATPPAIPHPFNMTIEPVTPLAKETPVMFNLTIALDTGFYGHPYLRDTGTVSARLFPYRDQVDTLYYESWPVQFDDTYTHSLDFPLTIPDNNVFVVEINVTCGGLWTQYVAFFITVGEEIEFTDILIDPPMPRGEGTEWTAGNEGRR